jgi:hypothetical protein
MAGNASYALIIGFVFNYLPATSGGITGVLAGSAVKFLIIGGAASYVLALPAQLTAALIFPQLYNALLGGLLAVFFRASLPLQIKN